METEKKIMKSFQHAIKLSLILASIYDKNSLANSVKIK